MAVTAKVFNLALTSLLSKQVSWSSDTIKVMLATSAVVPNQQTWQYQSSVTNEVTGTGYTAGGATLASKTEVITGQVKALDAADVSWASSTITARYAYIYDATPGTAATNPLLAYVDFGADVISSNGPFSITWDPSGIITFTVS